MWLCGWDRQRFCGYRIGPEANLTKASLGDADLTDANLSRADLAKANLNGADLYGAEYVETSTGSPYYYGNTVLPGSFDPVAQGWILTPYCDFTPDAACDVADINQMFEAGNLVTGVAVVGRYDRYNLSDNDTLNAADITEWLSQAATENGHSSPYLRGDTELDRDVDITDFNSLATHFDPDGATAPHSWTEGNFDGDNDIDITDFNFIASNFAPDGYGASAVPEPSALLLALLGLMLLAGARVQ